MLIKSYQFKVSIINRSEIVLLNTITPPKFIEVFVPKTPEYINSNEIKCQLK